MPGKKYGDVATYLDDQPDAVRVRLEEIRAVVREIAPDAEELIAYGIPTFHLRGHLIHYAGWQEHIALYPGGAPLEGEAAALERFRTGKGTLRIPLDEPLPIDAIKALVRTRLDANLRKGTRSRMAT